ncbi:SufE family protein [Estrella lausannensis]|uniref:Cysteine desulfuration protein SufE n=1 Tax=Estrella lausannensis TaxID=483423 RepID=A0A0H5DPP8_9BACT|nr:SufE family protein [Estrella lausannensis]CRX37988.1 Cysteine desulfuration protein SufE [Estrella lausannensis]
MNNESCIHRQNILKDRFFKLPNEEAKYDMIIQMGKKIAPMDPLYLQPENLVAGCQSQMFLVASEKEGKVFFQVASDALISAGLAALMLEVYNGETAETILTCPPVFIDELGIATSLTPSRANGLYSVHLRMKQEALKLIIKRQKQS